MRVLLLNQFFWPDAAATSQLLTDLARGLADRGHDVHVICADSGYAVPGLAARDSDDAPPVTIYRLKSAKFIHGPLGRVVSYGSFFAAAAVRSLTVPRPDVVVSLTTPPLLSLIGSLTQLLRRSKHFIWEMDVYPDVAVDLQYMRAGGLLQRLVGLVADFSRRRCTGILALGPCMRDRLLKRGIPAAKIHVAENWADGESIRPEPLSPQDHPLSILYSGNLGLAHDVDTIAGAMRELKNDPRFQFVFAGSGPRRKQLEAWCGEEEIRSVDFRPYSQRANLGESLSAGDIGLVTQKPACLGSVVPSKVYGLLAAGRPVLFIGPKESTVARIVNQFACGWAIEAGDVPALVTLLQRLSVNRTEVERAGWRARQAFNENYDVHLGVSRICALIGASVTGASGAKASVPTGISPVSEATADGVTRNAATTHVSR